MTEQFIMFSVPAKHPGVQTPQYGYDASMLQELSRRFPEVPKDRIIDILKQYGNNRSKCIEQLGREIDRVCPPDLSSLSFMDPNGSPVEQMNARKNSCDSVSSTSSSTSAGVVYPNNTHGSPHLSGYFPNQPPNAHSPSAQWDSGYANVPNHVLRPTQLPDLFSPAHNYPGSPSGSAGSPVGHSPYKQNRRTPNSPPFEQHMVDSPSSGHTKLSTLPYTVNSQQSLISSPSQQYSSCMYINMGRQTPGYPQYHAPQEGASPMYQQYHAPPDGAAPMYQQYHAPQDGSSPMYPQYYTPPDGASPMYPQLAPVDGGNQSVRAAQPGASYPQPVFSNIGAGEPGSGLTRSIPEDSEYVKTLLDYQRQRMEKLREDLDDSYTLLKNLRKEVGSLQHEVKERRNSKTTHVFSDSDIRKLKQENRKLQVDIQLLTREVDLVNDGKTPIGVTDPLQLQNFYNILDTGQQQHPSGLGNQPSTTPPPRPPPLSSGRSTNPPPEIVITPGSRLAIQFRAHESSATQRSYNPNIHPITQNPQYQLDFRSEDDDNFKWSCHQCTFLNHQDMLHCEMCDHPRM